MHSEKNKMIIYTDGACSGNPGPGGWAFVLFDGNRTVYEKASFTEATTNNRMEMQAAIEALRYILQLGLQETETILMTDSAYVVNGVTQWVYGWKKRNWKTAEGKDVSNKDLWLELSELDQQIPKIEWKNVPGHAGISGNERCDVLAVHALKTETEIEETIPVSSYSFDIQKLPEIKPKQKIEPYYLSLVNGIVEKHKDWSSCEARVKGRSGVRFKKIKTRQEEEETYKSWGI